MDAKAAIKQQRAPDEPAPPDANALTVRADYLMCFSLQGTLVHANANAEQVFRLRHPDGSFRNVREIMVDEAPEEFYRYVSSLENKEFGRGYVKIYDREGSARLLDYDNRIDTVDGEPCVHSYLRDITRISVLEEQDRLEKMATYVEERVKLEKVRALYYSIGQMMAEGVALERLYHHFFKELDAAIGIESFILTLKDGEGYVHSPYFVNSDIAFEGEIQAWELAEYGMEFGRAMFLYEEVIERLAGQRAWELSRPVPKVWIGVPLSFDDQVLGMIVVQSFTDRFAYDKSDLDLLTFVSTQLTSAILNTRNRQQINRQAARLDAIFESGKHLMWSIDRRMRLTRFNNNYQRFTFEAYGKEANVNLAIETFRPRYDRRAQAWLERYAKVFEGKSYQFEAEVQMGDGQARWLEVFLYPVEPEGQAIEEVSAIAHDITLKKRSEIALSASEEKFRSIVESFQDVYFQTDLEGFLTMASPSVYELAGLKPEEVRGVSSTRFFGQQQRLRLVSALLSGDGVVRNFSTAIRRPDGSERAVIVNFRLLKDGKGKPWAVEGVAKDISELKEANEALLAAKELAERSLEVKKQFLSNMSHEIRTPMNGIIGVVDLLNQTPLDQEQQRYVQTIQKSSSTLLHILNDILDLSKIEAGKMRLRPSPVCLPEALDKLLALFGQQAEARSTRLGFEIDPTVPPFLTLDETRLLQILSNLTSNAVKFTENGTIDIRAFADRREGERLWLRFEVEDTGAGIPAESLKALFHQFSQVETAYAKSHSGTGLGLAISKQLARLMNGQIGVRSRLGKGSAFWFTIETREANEDEFHAALSRTEQDNTVIVGNPHVLVTDDNKVNREVAASILRKAGCRVSLAESGAEAVSQAQKTTFDLLLMDIQMPGMDGLQAAKRIREASDSPPPIVAMTAFSMREEQQHFLDSGMDDCLSKPVRATSLIRCVGKWTDSETLAAPQASEPKRLTEKAAFDPKMAGQLFRYGGVELLRNSWEEFAEEATDTVVRIAQARAEKDWTALANLLHGLKGTAATVGAATVAESARLMERSVKQKAYPSLVEQEQALQKAVSAFVASYEDWLSERYASADG